MPTAIFSKLLSLPLLAVLLWFSWPYIGPHKPTLGPLRQELAEQVVVEIAEDLRTKKGGVVSVALIHFEADPTDYISENLGFILEQRGIFDLLGPPLPYRLRNVLNMRQLSHNSPAQAAQTARHAGLDAAIIGRIIGFESYSGGAKIELEYTLVSTDGAILYKSNLTKELTSAWTSPALPDSAKTILKSDNVTNTLIWLMAMLLLPIATIGFIRTAVRRNSNKSNAFVLAVYTAVSVIAAYVIIGATLSGIWVIGLLSIAGLVALFYNIKIVSFAIRLEEE